MKCHTIDSFCMTMLSFRVDEATAGQATAWASRLGVDRSELLREALRLHLLRLASERDAETWEALPLETGESSLAEISDWGAAEEWAAWSDAAG